MAGAVLSLSLVGCAAALTAGFVAVAGGAVAGQRVAGAADAAALAAADAASGAIPGIPCEVAATVAEASTGIGLTACDVDGLVATVTVAAGFAGLVATASARAGPAAEGG